MNARAHIKKLAFRGICFWGVFTDSGFALIEAIQQAAGPEKAEKSERTAPKPASFDEIVKDEIVSPQSVGALVAQVKTQKKSTSDSDHKKAECGKGPRIVARLKTAVTVCDDGDVRGGINRKIRRTFFEDKQEFRQIVVDLERMREKYLTNRQQLPDDEMGTRVCKVHQTKEETFPLHERHVDLER